MSTLVYSRRVRFFDAAVFAALFVTIALASILQGKAPLFAFTIAVIASPLRDMEEAAFTAA